MTYRRLFICLCLAGLLLLAGAWWSSLRYFTSLTISLPGGQSSVGCTGFSGTLRCALVPFDATYGSIFHTYVIAADQVHISGNEQITPFGNLEWGKRLIDVPGGTGYYYKMGLPLWLIYVAFIATSYLALRLPMRKQRLLEQQGAVSSNSPPGE